MNTETTPLALLTEKRASVFDLALSFFRKDTVASQNPERESLVESIQDKAKACFELEQKAESRKRELGVGSPTAASRYFYDAPKFTFSVGMQDDTAVVYVAGEPLSKITSKETLATIETILSSHVARFSAQK